MNVMQLPKFVILSLLCLPSCKEQGTSRPIQGAFESRIAEVYVLINSHSESWYEHQFLEDLDNGMNPLLSEANHHDIDSDYLDVWGNMMLAVRQDGSSNVIEVLSVGPDGLFLTDDDRVFGIKQEVLTIKEWRGSPSKNFDDEE